MTVSLEVAQWKRIAIEARKEAEKQSRRDCLSMAADCVEMAECADAIAAALNRMHFIANKCPCSNCRVDPKKH